MYRESDGERKTEKEDSQLRQRHLHHHEHQPSGGKKKITLLTHNNIVHDVVV